MLISNSLEIKRYTFPSNTGLISLFENELIALAE